MCGNHLSTTSRALNVGSVLTGTPTAPIIVTADVGRLREVRPRKLAPVPPQACVKLVIPDGDGLQVAHARRLRIDGPSVIEQVLDASGHLSVRLVVTGPLAIVE